jgi:hypothetical protein
MTRIFRHASVLALGLSCGCQLPPDLLEAGSEGDGDTSGGETGEPGETGDTGKPDPEPEAEPLECVLQGTNIDGGTDPGDFLLPDPADCEVVCAQGWGHGAPLLASEWTQPRESVGGPFLPTRGAVGIDLEGRPVMVFSGPDQPYHRYWLTPGGDPNEAGISTAIDGEVMDFGIDADQSIYYYVWNDGETQRLAIVQHYGEELSSLELGEASNSSLAVIDDGVIVAIDGTRLMRVNQAGDVLWDHDIPRAFQIDVSPSGDVIALVHYYTLSWADVQGNFLGEQPLTNASNLSAWLGLVAIDDANVVFAGAEMEPGFEGGESRHRGVLSKYGAMGPDWWHSYDRADTWCAEFDAHQTQELLTGVDQLGDGTLIVTGIESLGHPYGNDISFTSQPWVAHVTADGEVLAYDRGFWQGRTIDVVARDNVAYVLFTKDGSEDVFGLPYLRKYSF